MAKWGEGDPRWIVEERPDATNVNNWHWTEKNASEWSKSKIENLYKGLSFKEPGLGTVTITEVSKCEGESTANNRKGKLIFFYEWAVEMEWSAELEDESKDDKETKGKIEITNFSEENEPHEIDINVSIVKGGCEADKFKEFIRLKGIKNIRDTVALYIQALKDEYATDLILPTKQEDQTVTKQNKMTVSQDLANNVRKIRVSSPLDTKETSTKFSTTTIKMSQDFKCTAEEIFRALTVQEMVSAFTRGAARLTAEKGGKFELFGGNISGEFVEVIPSEQIVQKWRFKSWPDNHFSEVSLKITQGQESTVVTLKQSGVPVSDFERTKMGWQNYYWDAIKRTFGFGATLI